MNARAPMVTTRLVDAVKGGPKELRAWDRHKRSILEVLMDRGPMLTRDLCRALPALHTQVYRVADELVAEGLASKTMVVNTRPGWGRGGLRARWDITPHGVATLNGRRP